MAVRSWYNPTLNYQHDMVPAILVVSMAPRVQVVSQLNPVRHFVMISRAVLVKGAGLSEIARPFGLLMVYAVVVLTFAIRQYQKRREDLRFDVVAWDHELCRRSTNTKVGRARDRVPSVFPDKITRWFPE